MLCKRRLTLNDFESIKENDILVIEWHRDSYKDNKRTRFATYNVILNKKSHTEIILQKQNNVYFNYMMYLFPKTYGYSNVKNVILLYQTKG
jgi:hypothetical protein